jgi:hypothetical protein
MHTHIFMHIQKHPHVHTNIYTYISILRLTITVIQTISITKRIHLYLRCSNYEIRIIVL